MDLFSGSCFVLDDGNWRLIPLKLDRPGSYLLEAKGNSWLPFFCLPRRLLVRKVVIGANLPSLCFCTRVSENHILDVFYFCSVDLHDLCGGC